MSVQRVLAILMHFGENPAPATLADLGRALGMPKPSLLALLLELTTLDYIQRDEHGRFSLSRMAYRLALQLSTSDSIASAIGGALREAGQVLDMTISFAYLDKEKKGVIYADRYAAPKSQIRYMVKLGYPGDIHSASAGKILLANCDESEWRELLGPEPFPQYTPHTHTRYDSLAAELRRIRQSQVGWTRSERHYGIGGCAVPVYDGNGDLAACVAAHSLLQVVESHRDLIIETLRSAAGQIRKELQLRHIDATALPRHI